MTIACVTDGKLIIIDGAGSCREMESAFVRERLAEGRRLQEVHGWKARDRGTSAIPGFGSPWGQGEARRAPLPWRCLAVAPASAGHISYLLSNGEVTGMFLRELTSGEERRLWHRNGYQVYDLAGALPQGGFIAAIQDDDASVHLHRLDAEGHDDGTITSGDCRDMMPSLSRQHPNRIVYASAGLARDEGGRILALGPSAICRVDVESGEHAEVLARADADYLVPQEDAAGNLWCIRRPWNHPHQGSLGGSLLGFVTFPYRFLQAVMGFLQAFTHLYHRKPPQLADGPERPVPGDRRVAVLGQTISLAQSARHRDGDGPALVPETWELICRRPDGTIEVKAKRIAGFCLQGDGTLITTNGYRIDRWTPGGRETIARQDLAAMVVALD